MYLTGNNVEISNLAVMKLPKLLANPRFWAARPGAVEIERNFLRQQIRNWMRVANAL